MEKDANICRLCLKTIKKDDPYSTLTNNNAVLQSLNLISFVTIKNLQLTESPVICDPCDNKLKQLASFKENIITNEFQIQCYQKKDLNSFLENISKDFDTICRLCLQVSENASKLKEDWKDNKKLFNKCNIHLNLDIAQPSKICANCYLKLQNMSSFVSECCRNEKDIVIHSSKKGKLSTKDLLEITDSAKNVNKSNSEEDNNNFAQGKEKEKAQCSEKALHDESKVQTNSKKVDDSSEASKISSDNEHNEKEELVFKRTSNTYARAKSRTPRKSQEVNLLPSKLNILSDISIQRQAKPSTSKGVNNETKDDKELLELSSNTSIDVLPVNNVADITFEVDSNGFVEPDSVSYEKDNVTQELINLMEGTEELVTEKEKGNATKQYKDAEELLKVLEDDGNDNITVSVVIEEEIKNLDVRPSPSLSKKSENTVNTEETSSAPKKVQNNKDIIVTYTFVDVKDLKNKSPIKSGEGLSKIKCCPAQKSDKPVNTTKSSETKKVRILKDIKDQSKETTVKADVEKATKLNNPSVVAIKKINKGTDLKDKNTDKTELDQGMESKKVIKSKKVQNQKDLKDKSKDSSIKAEAVVEHNKEVLNASTEEIDQFLETKKNTKSKETQNKIDSKEKSKEKTPRGEAIVESNTKLTNANAEKVDQLTNIKKGTERKRRQNKTDLTDKSDPKAQKKVTKNSKEKTGNQTLETVVKSEADSTKAEESSSTPVGQKRHSLRQKTIVMSFREMLNMKPLKKKDQVNTECPPKDIEEKNISVGNAQIEEVRSAEKNASASSQAQVKGTRKKRVIKEVDGSKTEGPKKQAKKMIQKSILSNLHPTAKTTVAEGSSQLQEVSVNGKEVNEQTSVENQELVVRKKRAKQNVDIEASTEGKIVAASSDMQNVIANAQEQNAETEMKKPKKTTVEKKEKNILEKQSKKVLSTSDQLANAENTVEVSQLPEPSVEGKKHDQRTNVESKEKRVPKKRGRPPKVSSAESTANNSQEVNKPETREIEDQSQEVSVKRKKWGKRGNVEAEEIVVPQKRAKTSPHKELPGTEEPNTEKTAAEPVNKNDHTQTNGEVVPPTTKEIDSEALDSSDPEDTTRPLDKPFEVTIIRRKKKKNKALIDKTWQELTGAKVASTDGDQAAPKKKKGRPPLPDHLKKFKKKPPAQHYTCDVCPYKSISQNMLIQHQLIHAVVGTVTQFQCRSCSFKTHNKEILEEHKVTHLNLDMMFKCVFCDYSNKKKISAMYHTLRHDDKDIANMFYCLVSNQLTEEEYYECFQCDYQNAEEPAMPDHVIDHQAQEVTIRNPIIVKYNCKECPYKTKFEDMFKKHQEMHELKKKKSCGIKKEIKKEPNENSLDEEVEVLYSCEKCDYLTHNKRSLANHKGLKHTRQEEKVAYPNSRPPHRKPIPVFDQILHCNECSYTTLKKQHLARHVLVHRTNTNMFMLECPHCPFETKHSRSYKRHMEVRHKVIV